MPSPVLALPCGSRSPIRTRSPIAASAVARLMAVVVFPTPPFWLATVMIRGAAFVIRPWNRVIYDGRLGFDDIVPGKSCFKDDAVRIDLASVFYQIETRG